MNIDLKILDDRYNNEWPMPAPATEGSAGIDLRAANMTEEPGGDMLSQGELPLNPNVSYLFGTGIAIHIADPNYCAMIYPRSGLGHKHGLILGNGTGVIDSSYTGEIKVSLWNRSDRPYTIEPGERIAQLVLMPIIRPEFRVVSEFADTERGSGGFGSTGTG